MLKFIADAVFSFDVEWTPDAKAGEILHGVPPADGPGEEAAAAFEALWADARKEDDEPDYQPYLKTVLCRIVTLAGILREKVRGGEPQLKLVSLPTDVHDPAKSSEKAILKAFLKSVGNRKPQLVGYNSSQADLPIIIQRSLVNGLPGYGFSDRPNKPWEGPDYFDSRNSEYGIDLADAFAKYRDKPTLHQAATLSGIPGKIDVAGDSVAQMWLEGRLADILDYNEFDAFTTHLLWARVAHFSGLLSSDAYHREQTLVRELLESEIIKGKTHLERFVEEWERLQTLTGQSF